MYLKSINRVFLNGNVPSSKNSRINTGRYSFHSKTVKNYLTNIGIKEYSTRNKIVEFLNTPNSEITRNTLNTIKNFISLQEVPVIIGFHFVRGNKHKADFHNLVQILSDIFTAYCILEDDNMDYFIPVPVYMNNKWYSYDKENPGVFIFIMDLDSN